MSDLSIYIHWPFCKSKCPYCDFNSHVRDKIDIVRWQNSYINEIDNFTDIIKNKKITSIFFGGGTPSLMPPILVENIINKLASISDVTDTEITLEANPTSVEQDNFKYLRSAGINRISIGIQSLRERNLKFLGRNHSIEESIKAIELGAKLFDNYSFDLIYALPNQSLFEWEQELYEALKLSKNHLSLYQLTIEKGTEFYKSYKKQEFNMPSNDFAADFYDLTQDIMDLADMPSYEISNHARYGYESKHNLTYWRYNDYLGIGPGAHSRIGGKSIIMIYNPENWLESSYKKNNIQHSENLTTSQKLDEALIMGLRLKEGVNLKNISNKFSIDINKYLNMDKIIKFHDSGLLNYKSNNLALSGKNILLLNKIIEEITDVK